MLVPEGLLGMMQRFVCLWRRVLFDDRYAVYIEMLSAFVGMEDLRASVGRSFRPWGGLQDASPSVSVLSR